MNIAARSKVSFLLYWIGVACAIGAVGLVLLGNTKFGYSFEHAGFPLAWKLGIVAVMAFLADELRDWASPDDRADEAEPVFTMESLPYEF